MKLKVNTKVKLFSTYTNTWVRSDEKIEIPRYLSISLSLVPFNYIMALFVKFHVTENRAITLCRLRIHWHFSFSFSLYIMYKPLMMWWEL